MLFTPSGRARNEIPCCIDLPIVESFRRDGHVTLYVAEMEPGIKDDVKQANKEKAILLTADKDFGELVFRQGRISQGIILVRLKGLSPKLKGEIVGEDNPNYP